MKLPRRLAAPVLVALVVLAAAPQRSPQSPFEIGKLGAAVSKVLGPVDPQLGEQPAASIVKVLQRKPLERVHDHTIILADMAEKALKQVKETVTRLLSERMDADKAQKTAELLSQGTWTHDYPITVDQARSLGLAVNTNVPVEIYRMMSLYPQTRQRRPSVEYIPTPVEPADQKNPNRRRSQRGREGAGP